MDNAPPLRPLPPWLHAQGGGVLVDVLVAPRASRTRILDIHDNRLKVQLTASPVEGKANEALVRLVAGLLDVPRAQVEIVGGPTSRRKTVRILGVPAARVALRLTPHRD